MAYSDWQDHGDTHTDWLDHNDVPHEDWDDGGPHNDGAHTDWADYVDSYTDHFDHTDSDCVYTDWGDHTDTIHTDHTDHSDGGAHVDWDDHLDTGGHDDWTDAHADWTDHTDTGTPHTDWTDAHADWDDHTDGGDYTDWADYTDTHTDWLDHNDVPYNDHDDHDDAAHSDWDDHNDGAHTDSEPHSDTGHTDWLDHNDVPYEDWDDHDDNAHADWTDHTDGAHTDHIDYVDHDDGGHIDWQDHNDVPHEDWSNAGHSDLAHSDWDDHTDGAHTDWADYTDIVHIDWTDHNDVPHEDWDDHDDGAHSDHDDHDDAAHTDWADYTDTHVDWIDHNDTGEHEDWDDHTDSGGGAHADWTDAHADWDDHGDTAAHTDWTDGAYSDYDDHDDGGAHVDWDDHGDGGHADWTDHSDGGIPSGKTRVTAYIGGYDVSCYIISADIWRDALNGIGRWELILDNQLHWWGGAFAVDDDVTIRINGSLMMRGYVDDIFPHIDSKGEYTEFIKVNGRDYGLDLAQLYLSAPYENQLADDIVSAAILATVTEITYFSPAAAPIIDYEFDRTYLADGIRDIAKLVNYDYYVQDDVNRTLHFFDIATMGAGVEHTIVNLTSVAGAATNNILRFEIGEDVGFEVKNYIEAIAGDLNDHYTDLNAAAWAAPAFVTITNDTVFVLRNQSAIRMTTTANNTQLYMDLTFPQYNHTVLDLSETGTGRYIARPHNTTRGLKETAIRFRDTGGKWIEWYRLSLWPVPGSVPVHETTDNARNDAWRFIEFPYGDDADISIAGLRQSGKWGFIAPAVAPFDWANIDRIRFYADVAPAGQNLGDYVVIDGLEIPAVEVISISQSAVSIANYGTRMKDFYRPDIKNQIELDAYAVDQEAKYRDPVQSIKITAIGQVNSKYAAQSLDVQLPSSGIGALTPYRIFTLHHSVKLSPVQNEIAGYDFITEYELVKSERHGTDQEVDPTRVAVTHSPTRSMMRAMREQRRYNQTIRKTR